MYMYMYNTLLSLSHLHNCTDSVLVGSIVVTVATTKRNSADTRVPVFKHVQNVYHVSCTI